MVKLRVGKKKQAVVKDSGVVLSEFKKVHRFPRVPHVHLSVLKTRRGAAIAVAVLLVFMGITGIIFWRVQETAKPVVTNIPTEKGYADSKLSDLKENFPAANASEEERVRYYDQLQGYSELKEDYNAALDAFLKRANIRTSDLDYDDYARVAGYYAKLGDKQGAITAIDKAISILPASSTAAGYDRAQMKEMLEKSKQSL